MQKNKLLFVLLLLLSFNSCKQQNKKDPTIKEPFCSEEIKFLDSLLNLESGITIIRTGSIEGCYGYSVLTFKENQHDSDFVSVSYSMVDLSRLQTIRDRYETNITPSMFRFFFSLKKPKIDLNSFLDQVTFIQSAEEYSAHNTRFYKRMLRDKFGEGYGSNQYIVFDGEKKQFGYIDKFSPQTGIEFVNSLFRQISVAEYIQTYSLEKNWADYRDSVSLLMTDYETFGNRMGMKIVNDY